MIDNILHLVYIVCYNTRVKLLEYGYPDKEIDNIIDGLVKLFNENPPWTTKEL